MNKKMLKVLSILYLVELFNTEMVGVKRFGRVELSKPDYFLNIVLIRDVTEKLLAHILVTNELRIPSDMQYIQDMDYGLIICVDYNGKIQAAFYVGLTNKEPISPLIRVSGHDVEYIVTTLVKMGHSFTDF